MPDSVLTQSPGLGFYLHSAQTVVLSLNSFQTFPTFIMMGVTLSAWHAGSQISQFLEGETLVRSAPPDLILPSLILNSGQLDDHKGFVAALQQVLNFKYE